MADPKKPFSPVNLPPEARKPKGPRKKLSLSGALRRIELIMEDFSPETKIKLAEYAMMHAKECATAKVMTTPPGFVGEVNPGIGGSHPSIQGK